MPDRNHFDRSKPFYPLVMNYVATLHGFKMMLLESALIENPGAVPCTIARYFRYPDGLDDTAKKQFEKAIGPLELVCRCGEPPVVIPYDYAAKEYGDNRDYLLEHFPKHAVFGLFTLAWEDTYAFHDAGPLWEFLRHTRNAAAHNGR